MGDDEGDIELLVVPGCPNQAAAAGLVRGVLDELGRTDTPFPVRVVSSQADAERSGFTGSPTFLIDGADPFAEQDRAAALACRLYATPAGLRGLPDANALRAADLTGGNRASPSRSRPIPSPRACGPGRPATWTRWRRSGAGRVAARGGARPVDCVGRGRVMALLRRRRAERPAHPVHVRRIDEHTWTVSSDARPTRTLRSRSRTAPGSPSPAGSSCRAALVNLC